MREILLVAKQWRYLAVKNSCGGGDLLTALASQLANVVSDVLGRDLSITQRPVWQSDIGDIEAGAFGRQDLCVRPRTP